MSNYVIKTGSNGGGGLTPIQTAAVTSIITATPDEILVSEGGTSNGILVNKGITVTDDNINTNGRSVTASVDSFNLGDAWRISSSGDNISFINENTGVPFHPVTQTFEDGNTAKSRVRTTLAPQILSDKTADLVDPSWDYTVNDETIEQIKFDFVNAVTGLVIEVDLAVNEYYSFKAGNFAIGEQNIILDPPLDVRNAQTITFTLSAVSGNVTVKGNSVSGIPWQELIIADWVDTPIVLDTDINLKLARGVQTTGIVTGGSVTAASISSLNIASGTGRIVDLSDQSNPVVYEVSWDNVVNYTPVNIGNNGAVVFAFDRFGTLSEIQSVDLDNGDIRDFIIVGVCNIFTGQILNIDNNPLNVGYDGVDSFKDFFRDVIGPSTIEGCVYGPNGVNLNIDLLGGKTFTLGGNFRIDPSQPDERLIPSATTIPFFRLLRDGNPNPDVIPDGPPTILINPTQWDDNSGILQTVAANDFSVQVIFLTTDGLTVVQYAQEIFNTLANAVEAIQSGSLAFQESITTKFINLRAYLVVKGNATDLSDPTQAEFITASKFRLSGVTTGGGITGVTSPASPVTSVQFNDGGTFGGSADFTWDDSTKLLSALNGNVLIKNGATVFPATSRRLRVENVGASGIQISAGGANNCGIDFGNESNAIAGQILFRTNTGNLEFWAGGAKIFDINGNVEIFRDTDITGILDVSAEINNIKFTADNTTDTQNIFIGEVNSINTGSNNVAIGKHVLEAVFTGNFNIGIGDQVLSNGTTISNNIALGSGAMDNLVTTSNSLAIGVGAQGAMTAGTQNIALGHGSMGLGIGNASCIQNVALGIDSLRRVTTGEENVTIGHVCGDGILAGSFNVLIGGDTGRDLEDGNSNIIIGRGADVFFPSCINNIIFGDAQLGSSTVQDNFLNIGGVISSDMLNEQVRIGGSISDAFEADTTLELKSTTGAFLTNRMTTTERDALSAKEGMIIYNTTLSKHQGFDGFQWNDFW